MPVLTTSNRVIRWETHRGRNNEFDQSESGTAQITLQNRDGLFDPLKAASEYVSSGYLLPVRQVQINTNTPANPSSSFPIFSGYIEGWNYERKGPRGATATVDLVDGFELLTRAEIPITRDNPVGGRHFASVHVDDRIRAALGFAGWNTTRESIFSGNVIVQEVDYPAGTSMLSVIQEAVEAEFPGVANFYIAKDGRATFRGRMFRLQPFNDDWNRLAPGEGDPPEDRPGGPSREALLYKFGDDGAIATWPEKNLIPLANLEWVFNKDRLYNNVAVIPNDLPPEDQYFQVAKSVELGRRYGRRNLTISGLLTLLGDGPPPQTAAQECKRFSLFFLQSYALPIVRATNLEVHSKFEDDRIWDFLVNVEISDVIELWTVNPGSGGFRGQQFYVDGINNEVDAVGDWPQWVSNYDLTPRGYWGDFPDPFE